MSRARALLIECKVNKLVFYAAARDPRTVILLSTVFVQVGHSPQRLQSGVEVGKYVIEEAESLQLGEAAQPRRVGKEVIREI